MRRWSLILCAVWIGCGGSEFESTVESDASADTGGAGGEATGGTGGEMTGGTGASSGSSGAAGSSGASGAAGAAGTANPCEGTCAPSVAGWDGPFVVREGDGLPPLACPNPYLFHAELESPSDCPCACQEDKDGDRRAVVRWYTASDCGGSPCGELPIQVGSCKQVTTSTCTPHPTSADVIAAGFCEVIGPTDPPEPTWGMDGQSCPAVPKPGTCDGADSCYAPLAPSDRLCVLHAETEPCPAPYGEQRIRYQDYDDERKCSPCVCEPTNKVGTLTQSTAETCSAPSPFSAVPEPCLAVSVTNATYLKYTNITGVTVDCAPRDKPKMSGEAAPTGEVTFCCLP